ncbi:MAG: hypothetical protein R3275_03270 [Saprospiraceae bacterium]|nr:hypothetical protein [Saprospiraceae bacterium]
MKEFVNYLAQRPALNLFLLISYYLLTTLPHDWIGVKLEFFRDRWGLEAYNQYVLIIALGVFVLLMIWIMKMSWNSPDQRTVLLYLLVTFVLAVITVRYLFMLNIEMVHFLQYAIFSVLCFPLVGNYTRTLLWTMTAGIFDEAYQYFYLAPHRTDYFDLNDVIANMVGGAFGLVLLRSSGILPVRIKPYWQTSAFWIHIIIVFVFLVLWISGIIGIYPGSKAGFLLVKTWPEEFWTVQVNDVTFHIIRPLEGVVIISALIFIYSRLDK